MLLIHRARDLVMKQRTAQANQIRGLLAECGIVIPKGIQNLKPLLSILEDNRGKITEQAQNIFKRLCD